MRRLCPFALMLVLSLMLLSVSNAAQEVELIAKLHPWGQFEPGAWKLVRVTTETLNEQGQVVGTSSTDTKTTLVDIDNEGITLEIQARVEVVGKRFEPEPQTVKQGFHGELLSPNLKIKEPTDGQIVIDDQKIPCKIQQSECSGPNGKTVTTVYYSMSIAPYLFRRESSVIDPEGKTVGETTMEVTSLEMPRKVLDELNSVYNTKSAFHVKTVHRNTKGTITTLAVISPEIPGGVISHSSNEVDKNGRTVCRNTLKLIDYSTEPDQNLFRSKRENRRRAKTTSH